MAQNTRKDAVTASEVRSVKFQLIRRGGYDPGQVDPFLELVAQSLDGGPEADRRVDAAYVHNVRFTTVRRGGYLPSQVDDFLDRVIETLNGSALPAPLEQTDTDAAAAMPAPPPPPPVSVDPPPPAPPTALVQPQSTIDDVIPEQPPAETVSEPIQAPESADDEIGADGADLTPEADFDRLRILHDSGVISDKEFAVLGARVRRRIESRQSAASQQSDDSSALV